MKRITECEVCGNAELLPALDLGDQPMCDDLVPIGSDLVPARYPLQIVGCARCLTFHQAVQVEKRLLFPQTYHYRSALTADVLRGMRELVADVESHVGSLQGKTVLDIGCNDGSLLAMFGERGARTCGVEPTGAIDDARGKVDWLYHGYFDQAAADAYLAEHAQPDIVTFTNVFAHIEDLRGLLSALRSLLGARTRVVVENHYLGAVAKYKQFDTFYHEHPRTYSARSFVHIAESLGRGIERIGFPSRYNGNIRVIIGAGEQAAWPALDEAADFQAIFELQAAIVEGRQRLQDTLRPLVARHGPLPAKAFPGRASINVHCLGLNESLIDATYERSQSPKVGYYIPGTRIEIRDEQEFFDQRVASPVLVNLAWHIHEEIVGYMRSRGYRGDIIKGWIEP